jgi:hypothetical protein
MAAPFPGMDPYLEGPEWPDFHHCFMETLRESLNRVLEPRYIARLDRRIYFESSETEASAAVSAVAGFDRTIRSRSPDLTVSLDDDAAQAAGAVAVADEPVIGLLPELDEVREVFLEIRELETSTVVTVIEVLSPTNKNPNADGRAMYLAKRDAVLQSQTHLVEIDLLRGGSRLPMRTPLPGGDYYVIVSRTSDRPQASIFSWKLRDRLPRISVPLLPGDPDVTIDLQDVFATTYDRGSYARMLRPLRDRPLSPALSKADQKWAAACLSAAAGGT